MIRWISDYLGTASHGQIDAKQGLRIIDVRDLVDKPGNLPKIARDKIDQGVASLQKGEKVVVCCDYGISRSNAIAAGILSLHEAMPFNDAVRKVLEATKEKEVKIEVLSAVRDAVEERTQRNRSQGEQRRIFVTGGSGFIGAALVKKLRDKHEVWSPRREEIDLGSGPVNLDLFVREHDVDCIVHLANPRIYNTNQAMGDSLVQLKNVLDVCRQNQVRLIYPSGWEVYSGYRANSLLASESLPPQPRGIYGETKFLCEQLLEQHRREHGLDYVLMRSGPVYGGESDRPKFIFNFLAKALAGQKIVAHKYLNGYPTLDLLHIDDLISALAAIVEADYSGTIHVGSGVATSTTEVAALIIKATGSPSEVGHVEIQDYAANVIMDYGLARAILGWQPTIAFEEGLQKLIEKNVQSQIATKAT